MRSLFWAAASCALACASAAAARPYTVNDALRLESLGVGVIDPSGRWLILERQGPYEAAPRFDNDVNTRPVNTHLLRVDLRRPALGVEAFPQSRGAGYIAGPFSPSGRSMVVYRDQGHTWEIGLVTVATRKVRWLGFGVEFADRGDTLVWRSDQELLALALPRGGRYYKERLEQSAMLQAPGLWRRSTSGRGRTDVAVGSGAFIDTHLPDPLRRVLTVDATSGRTRELARGAFQRLTLSTSGHRLALVETYGRVRLRQDQLISQATQYGRTRLRLLDITTGALAAPCGDLEVLANSLRWSPADDQLLAVLRSSETNWSSALFRSISPEGVCTELPIEGLKPSVTLSGDAATATAHLDWLGDAPIALATAAGQDRSDWYALRGPRPVNLTHALPSPPDDPVAFTTDHALFLDRQTAWSIDRAGNAVALGGPRFDHLLSPRRTNMSAPLPPEGPPRGAHFLAVSADADTTRLWALSATEVRPLLEAPVPAREVMAATPTRLVTRTTDAHGVQTVGVWDGRRQDVAARANGALAGVEFVQPLAIEHPGPEGQTLKSWLYLPPNASARNRPPVVVIAYPSASFREPPVFGQPGLFLPVDSNAQLAVAHGYAVLVPSLPIRVGATDPGKGWDKAILDIVDKVGATQPVDVSRLAYWGHSFGGYVGLMLATQTQRFRAIIVAAPISDLISFRAAGWSGAWLTPEAIEAAQGWAGWSELGPQGHLMSTPWTNREGFIENSAVFHADRIHTPILLIHGDQDSVDVGQSREMFSDLYRLDKDALFLTFYGEGHSISSPQNFRALAETAYRFLDRCLQGPSSDGDAKVTTASIAEPTLRSPPPAAANRNRRTEPSASR